MNEEAVQFGNGLVGIVTNPSIRTNLRGQPAFIFLNSGILHRIGPNRLHVTMARELAEQGFLAFRIDLSGIGDSPASGGGGRLGERWAAETRAAMDYLAKTKGVDEFALVGNCSGAFVALWTAKLDRRVVGAALINLQAARPYLRYYLKLILKSPVAWRRLFRGTVRHRDLLVSVSAYLARLRSGGSNEPAAETYDVEGALAILAKNQTNLLMVYSYWDPSLDHFNVTLLPKLRSWISKDILHTEVIPGINHDFNLISGQKRLCVLIRNWAEQLRSPVVQG